MMRTFIELAAPATRSSRGSGRMRPVRVARRLARDERGGVSIAYILWTGMFATALTVVADLSHVFMVNAEMWHLAHDAARRISVADMTADEAEVYIRWQLSDSVRDAAVIRAAGGTDVEVEITLEFMTAEPQTVEFPVLSMPPMGEMEMEHDHDMEDMDEMDESMEDDEG